MKGCGMQERVSLDDEMASERDLVPLVPQETREIVFDDDVLLVALVDGISYVALKPIAVYMGIEWSAQYRRLKRDDILNEEKRLVVMVAGDGKAKIPRF